MRRSQSLRNLTVKVRIDGAGLTDAHVVNNRSTGGAVDSSKDQYLEEKAADIIILFMNPRQSAAGSPESSASLLCRGTGVAAPANSAAERESVETKWACARRETNR